MLKRILVDIWRKIAVFFHLVMRKAESHECEHIMRILIFDVVIFVSRRLNHLDIMKTASRPNGIHAAGLIVLIPAPASSFRPTTTGVPCLSMCVEGVGHVLPGLYRVDSFALHLIDHFDDIFTHRLKGTPKNRLI